MKKKKIIGAVCAIVGGICWGFSGCCGQYLFTEKNANTAYLSTFRLLTAGLMLWIAAFFTRREELFTILKNKKDAMTIVIFGVVGLMFCQYSYMNSIKFSNAPTATVIQYVGPILVTLVVCVMERRLPNRLEVFAVLLAMVGTYLIATHGKWNTLVISQKGLFWCLMAAVAIMVYTLSPGDILKRYSGTVVNAYGLLIGGVVMALLSRIWNASFCYDWQTILGFLGMTVVGTVIAFTLYMQALKDIGPIWTSVIVSDEIISSAVISYFWFGHVFAWIDIIGIIMILATIVLLALKNHKI